jgi:hypothetical protein
MSTKSVELNGEVSIHDNLNPDSNITEKSDLHSQKHLSSMTSIDEGRIISTISVLLNAAISIRDNLNPDSNATEESDLHR